MALFFGHALPYMATNNDGNLYAELLPADQRVEAASGTQEVADGCLDSRVVDLRSRVEEQLNANLLFNSSMAGATGSVLPTNWASGSVSGLTYTISSASAVAGFQAIEWTVSGTALSDGDIYLACEPMQSGSVVAQIPSEYVGSMYCAKVSGTIKAAMVLQTLTQNFVDGAVQETKTKDLAAVTGTTFVRIEPNSVKTDIDLENRVNLRLYQPIASGEVVDFTIRVAAPQVEAGFAASPFISTVSGAVSEVRGRPSILVVPQLTKEGVVYPQIPVVSGADFTFSRDTTATRVNASGLIESVASGVLRLDYPIGGGCPAALIEPSATNLALQSEAFNVTWSAQSSTQVSANTTATTDPAGGNNADFIFCTASGNPVQGFNQNINVTASGTYTMSVFVKKAVNFDWFRLQFRDAAGNQSQAYYNIASGTLGTIDGGSTATISNYGNGWYRITHSRSTASGSLSMGVRLASADNQPNVDADGNSGTYTWGAQVEAGSIATTYIPTTTTTASRAADVISASGALVSGLIGQTEGTVYFDLTVLSKSSSSTRWLQIFGASNNIGLALIGINHVRSIVNSQSDSLTTSPLTTSGIKIAWAYNASGTVCFINGTQYTLTNGGNQTMSSLTSISIDGSASLAFGFARIRAAALYTTRLSNDQLANLTALT